MKKADASTRLILHRTSRAQIDWAVGILDECIREEVKDMGL